MNWMDDFIENTLEKVPEGRYRKRAEEELRDHLETQCRTLTEAGRTAEEAQTEALRVMGEPRKLQVEYEAAWRRTLEGRLNGLGQRLGVIAAGCLLMGALYIYTAMFLSLLGFTYDGVSPHPQTLTGRNFPILGDGPALTIFGASLFLIPFPLGALFLKFRFLEGAPSHQFGHGGPAGRLGRGEGGDYRAVRADLPNAPGAGPSSPHLPGRRRDRALVYPHLYRADLCGMSAAGAAVRSAAYGREDTPDGAELSPMGRRPMVRDSDTKTTEI